MPGGHVLGDKSPGDTGKRLTTDFICVIWKVDSSLNRYRKQKKRDIQDAVGGLIKTPWCLLI